MAVPGPADAAEAFPLEFLTKFLDQVQQLGPWGPAAFILAVVCAEMIPLFPTQPLALSSGLLFGAQEGAFCTILSTTLAASIAYTVAQGLGKNFAKKLIDREVGEALGKEGNAAQRALSKVQTSAEKGTFWQQFSAVLALRMTPVIPFSATNYLLGISSVPFKPFIAATFAAMAVWGPLYASIGAASRGVLNSRGDVGAVFSDLQARTGEYSEKGAEVALVAGVIVLGLWATGILKTDGSDDPDAGRVEQK
ncbi:g7723 [Coccomyxa viridis]|uniref:G7723 protein n=1 Tax=Coccomyxa viridis TaxID=1274662 RepID=A0ABP1G3H0_9CHLO